MYLRSEVCSPNFPLQRSTQKQNIGPDKLHRFTSNVDISLLTDHRGWNGEAFPCPVWYKFHDIWFLVHITINIFIFDFELLQAKCHFLQKRNYLVPFGYCRCVIKYFMSDMMNYYCLRVFRSRVRSIGKHLPSFVFSELECRRPLFRC